MRRYDLTNNKHADASTQRRPTEIPTLPLCQEVGWRTRLEICQIDTTVKFEENRTTVVANPKRQIHNMPRSAAQRKMQLEVSGRALGVEIALAGWLAG